jgi:hypothetical protein
MDHVQTIVRSGLKAIVSVRSNNCSSDQTTNVDPGVRHIGAGAPDLSAFEKPQQARLKRGADRTDVGDEDRAAVRSLENSAPVAIRAVAGPPEQL